VRAGVAQLISRSRKATTRATVHRTRPTSPVYFCEPSHPRRRCTPAWSLAARRQPGYQRTLTWTPARRLDFRTWPKTTSAPVLRWPP